MSRYASLAAKLEKLLRLAGNAGATGPERETARKVADRIARELEQLRGTGGPSPSSGASSASSAGGPWGWSAPSSAGYTERRGGVDCWVGDPPTHGPRCQQFGQGCPDCLRIEAFRRWLNGSKAGKAA